MAGKLKKLHQNLIIGFISKLPLTKLTELALKEKEVLGLDTSLPIFDKFKKN